MHYEKQQIKVTVRNSLLEGRQRVKGEQDAVTEDEMDLNDLKYMMLC